MKTAYAYWENRIAPVFDSAQQIFVVDTNGTRSNTEQKIALPAGSPFQKAAHLTELGIQKLVCGAISRPLHDWLLAQGVNVIAFVAGDLQEVIRANISGELQNGHFSMPGCNRRRQRGMNRGLSKGRGSAQGRGQCINCGMDFGHGAGNSFGHGMGRARNNQK